LFVCSKTIWHYYSYPLNPVFLPGKVIEKTGISLIWSLIMFSFCLYVQRLFFIIIVTHLILSFCTLNLLLELAWCDDVLLMSSKTFWHYYSAVTHLKLTFCTWNCDWNHGLVHTATVEAALYGRWLMPSFCLCNPVFCTWNYDWNHGLAYPVQWKPLNMITDNFGW
jgi:hypothetical protein